MIRRYLTLIILTLTILLFSNNIFANDLIAMKQKTSPKIKRNAITLPYEAYVVADAETGEVLEGLNIMHGHPQASLTKIMLACVIVDKIEAGELQLTDQITASKKATKMGGTSVFLKAKETFTLEELMQAVLVQSANDAAYAIAEHVAGSSDSFVNIMNQKANSLGMNSTVFYSVHGLPPVKGGHDNITSCNDMILLAQEALKSQKIMEWASIERTTFRNGTLIIHNHNRLLGKVPEVDGIKTGFTRRAGFNIVATGKNDERRIIVVVLGSPEHRIRDNFATEKFKEYLVIKMADVSE